MYEQHFGLKNPVSQARPVGNAVFVGPQTARTMAGFRKALAAQDAVVTVSGPVGIGKTTLVERSVDAMGRKYKTIRVGRMAMDASDVLEALLVVLGVSDRPAGTIQRFATLRRVLKELEDRDVRVFILVEDAVRTGPETLAELEALTAADAGESGGASIVVMGDERLPEFMQDPQLAQLQQRVRQRHTILPFGAAELRGYLTHCFRVAGVEFETIFDAKCAELLQELSGGIARIVNNHIESVLNAAARKGIDKISASFVAEVVADEYGVTVDDFDFSIQDASTPEEEASAAPVTTVEPTVSSPEEEPSEPSPVEAEAAPAADSNETETAKSDEAAQDSCDTPHLIQDTLPDLEILAPELAPAAATDEEEIPELEPLLDLEAEPESKSETSVEDIPELEPLAEDIPELEPLAEDIPELQPLAQAVAEEPRPETKPQSGLDPDAVSAELPKLELEFESEPPPPSLGEITLEAEDMSELLGNVGEGEPAANRDPTLAELQPDLEALEKAMALAHGEAVSAAEVAENEAEELSDKVGANEEIPEITLDKSIETGVGNLLDDQPVEIQPAERAKKSDAELGEIAAGLGGAKTLEDVDDKLAETLFGTEISMIAAQMIANPPIEESANDESADENIQLEIVEPAQLAVGAEQPAQAAAVSTVTEEASLETRTPANTGGIDVTASQRLKTVRALNAKVSPPAANRPEPPKATGFDANAGDSGKPASAVDQMKTSTTQTAKAPKTPDDLQDDEPDEGKKKGFFSRFRLT